MGQGGAVLEPLAAFLIFLGTHNKHCLHKVGGGLFALGLGGRDWRGFPDCAFSCKTLLLLGLSLSIYLTRTEKTVLLHKGGGLEVQGPRVWGPFPWHQITSLRWGTRVAWEHLKTGCGIGSQRATEGKAAFPRVLGRPKACCWHKNAGYEAPHPPGRSLT